MIMPCGSRDSYRIAQLRQSCDYFRRVGPLQVARAEAVCTAALKRLCAGRATMRMTIPHEVLCQHVKGTIHPTP